MICNVSKILNFYGLTCDVIKYIIPLNTWYHSHPKGSDSDIEWKLILIHPSRRNQLSTPNDAPKEWRLQLKYKRKS